MIAWLRAKWDRRGGGPECRYITDMARRDAKRLKRAERAARWETNRRGVV